MTNEELVEQIQSGVNVQHNMGELYKQNERLIYSIISKYSKELGSSMPKNKTKTTTVIEKDDVMQECYFALQKAVDGFDVNRGYKFSSYLTWWMEAKAKRYVHESSNTKRIPEHELLLMSKYHKFMRDYRTEHQEDPSDQAVMAALGISNKKLHNLVNHIYESNIQSIETFVPGTESVTIGESIPDDYDLEGDVLDRVAMAGVWEAVDELNDNQKAVILGRYKNNLTQGNIAEECGVSRGRISEIERKALKVLRKKEKVKRLAAECGYDCGTSYKYGVGRFKHTNTSSTEFIALKHIELEQREASLDDIFNQIINMA